MTDEAEWFGGSGVKARARALTPKELTPIGKKGATARWSNKKKGGG